MSIKLCFLILALAVAVVFAQQNPFAKEISDCHTKTKPDDTKMAGCIKTFWETNKAKIVAGIVEINVPVLDPMSIANIQFSEKGTVVDVVATFINVIIKGIANHKAVSVALDRTAKTLTLTLNFPVMYVTGNYDIKGTILLTPVEGKGPFTLNMTDINAVATCHLINEAGKLKVNKLDINFTIVAMRVDLTGLLQGDTVGEAVVNMINDNSHDILADVKPKVQQQLSEGILQVLRSGFTGLNASDFGL